MKKTLFVLILLIFTSSVFASDEKPGRFFEDQPDVTDQPQVHFIYLLNKNSNDNECDISAIMEAELLEANQNMLEITKGKKKGRRENPN